MKRLFPFFLMIMAGINLVMSGCMLNTGGNGSAAPSDENPNLIVNGEFKNGSSGWNISMSDGAIGNLSVQNEQLAVNVSNAGDTLNVYQTGLRFVTGKAYLASFEAKAAAPTSIYVIIGMSHEGLPHYSGYNAYNLGTAYKKYYFAFTMTEPTDANSQIEFQLGDAAAAGITVFFDNIVIKEIKNNMISNGDFSGGMTGWEINVNTAENAAGSVAVANGEAVLSIQSGGLHYWDFELKKLGLAVERGKTYIVSFDARANTTPVSMNADVALYQSPWTRYSRDEQFALANDQMYGPPWAYLYKYYFVFTMDKDTDANAYLPFGCGGNAGPTQVFIDNVVMTDVDLTPPPDTTGPLDANFRLPPLTKKPRSYPKLVDYFHKMDLAENNIPNREEYLAQWDVIILNPQMVKDQSVSLARIREANPNIKILAWIPFGQSSLDWEMSTTFPTVADYFIKDTAGNCLRWWWGGYWMNPYKNNFTWTKWVVSYIEANYLTPGMYDGVMFDTLAGGPPLNFSPEPPDVDEDGDYDPDDITRFQAGIIYLLSALRTDLPNIIITGNGGVPWPDGWSYYTYVNGPMAENAFGDFIGGANNALWDTQWNYYTAAADSVTAATFYYFMSADIQYQRTIDQAKDVTNLTPDDKRRFRLALTTTLLRDGYFGFDRGSDWHGQLWWFNEYDVDLGDAEGGHATNAYAAGTYSREFAHGVVIVNPAAASVAVSFDEDHIDASTGVLGKAFVLPAGDGRIYMKTEQ